MREEAKQKMNELVALQADWAKEITFKNGFEAGYNINVELIDHLVAGLELIKSIDGGIPGQAARAYLDSMDGIAKFNTTVDDLVKGR